MKTLVRMMLCLMICFSLVELPITKAHAGMISTSETVAHIDLTEGQASVANFLNRNDVKEELIKLGVNPTEAHQRLASLNDSEVRQLAVSMDNAAVGGSITGILVLVLLVLGIIYLAKRV